MSGLTAPPDNAAPPAGQVIAADGWFPPIDTADIRAKVRLGDGAVSADRLAEATIAGILSGLRALAQWRSGHVANGIENLAGVTEETVADQNMAVLLWNRVVMFYAAAEIFDGHTDIAATDDALDREDEKRTTADLYRRRAYEAVADLLAIGVEPVDGAVDLGRNRVDLL
jgi:hypothetical protein